MPQQQPTKPKLSKIAYRSAVGFDERTAQRIFTEAERKGIGIADVIRIAVSEYIERLPVQTN